MISKECLSCGFYDPDFECSCPPDEHWYACSIHVPTEEEKIYLKAMAYDGKVGGFIIAFGLFKLRIKKKFKRLNSRIRSLIGGR